MWGSTFWARISAVPQVLKPMLSFVIVGSWMERVVGGVVGMVKWRVWAGIPGGVLAFCWLRGGSPEIHVILMLRVLL